MATTALLVEDGQTHALDASRDQDDLGGGTSWEQIYKVRDPRPNLQCRVCENPMHAKHSPQGRRGFTHDKRSPHCPASETSESEVHKALKHLCAQWIREHGYEAELEAVGDGWRADVLATGADGARIAFEIQVSAQTEDEARARTERYARDGIACVWIAVGEKNRPWYRPNGALVVPAPDSDDTIDEHTWTVVDGCATWTIRAEGAFRTYGHWEPVAKPDASLKTMVQWITDGRIVPSRPEPHATPQDWWWVYATERAAAEDAGAFENPTDWIHRTHDWRLRQRALRAPATAAAKNRWPGLSDSKIERAQPGEDRTILAIDPVVYGELVVIRFDKGKTQQAGKENSPPAHLFALLLPDVIAEDEREIKVLADNWSAAEKISRRYPEVRVAVPEGSVPWTLYRYRDEAWIPAGRFGEPSKRAPQPAKPKNTAASVNSSAAVSIEAASISTSGSPTAAGERSTSSTPDPASVPQPTPPSPPTPPVSTRPAAEPKPPVRPSPPPKRLPSAPGSTTPLSWTWWRRAALIAAVLCMALAGLLATVTDTGFTDLLLWICGIEASLLAATAAAWTMRRRPRGR